MLASNVITYGAKGSFQKTIFQAVAIGASNKTEAKDKISYLTQLGTGCI